MSQLETFYILFKAETADLKKQITDVEKNLGKLQSDLGSVDKAAQKTGESFHSLLKSAVGLFAGFASFHAVLSGAQGAIESIRQVGQASRELQVDVGALDAWGHAVQRTGGTAEGFQHSLEGLAQHFGTTNEIALRVLPRLADMFSRLNPRNAQIYGKSLGLDQATILLLQQGRREVEDTIKQQQRFGLVTKQQIEVTRKFDNALYDAGRAYQQFYRELVTPLLPGFTKAIEYLIEHKDLVVGAFIGVGTAAAILSAPFIAANIAVIGVTTAVFALIAAFALVFEDIKKFKEGAASVTGYVVNKTKALRSRNDERVSHLPEWIQIALGTKAPQTWLGKSTSTSNATTVNIGEVKIATQATDANGIALAAADSLRKHISQTIDNMDNGVAK